MSDDSGADSVSLKETIQGLTYNELHLFWMGLYSGFVAMRPKHRQEPKASMKESLNWESNKWYWQGAYILGYILKVILLGGTGMMLGPEGIKNLLAGFV